MSEPDFSSYQLSISVDPDMSYRLAVLLSAFAITGSIQKGALSA